MSLCLSFRADDGHKLKDAHGCKRAAVQSARVDLREAGLMDNEYRLTAKGLEQALELGKDQTAFDEEEQSEED